MPNKVFRVILVAWWAVVLFSACSHTPEGVLSEKKMRDVLVDMQMAETIINEDPYTYSSFEKKNALFQSVFQKHRLTQAEYDSSLMWYGRNIDIYMRVYDMAMEEVDERIKDLGDVKAEAFDAFDADSIDLWVDKKYYVFSSKAVSNLLVFDLNPSEPYPADSRFVWEMQLWGLAMDKNQLLEVNLRAEQMDTTLMEKTEISHDGFHRLTLHGLSDRPINRVYGYIRMKSSLPHHKIYIDCLQLTKYRDIR